MPDWRQEAIVGTVPSDTWMVVGSILGYSAHCHCGWVSATRNDGPEAHGDLNKHWIGAHVPPEDRPDWCYACRSEHEGDVCNPLESVGDLR